MVQGGWGGGGGGVGGKRVSGINACSVKLSDAPGFDSLSAYHV